MSRRKKGWLVVVLAAALMLLIPLSLRWQAQWHLSACRKKLIASGEKLTIEELAPKRSGSATNTARFLRLASMLPNLGDHSPSTMLPIKPGVARVASRQPQCLERMAGSKPAIDVWPVLIGVVRTNEQTFGELKTIVDAGGIEFIEDYSQQNLNWNTYLSWQRQLSLAFSARTMLALRQGRTQEACDYLIASGSAAQLLAKDPVMIDQLVFYACMSIIVGDCWEFLQAGGWTDGQLAQLQRQWEQPFILAAAESTLAMERARGTIMFQAARSSRQELDAMLGGESGIKKNNEILDDSLLSARTGMNELLTSYPRYWGWRWIWSFEDEQRYLEVMQSMMEVTRDAQRGRSILSSLKERKTLANQHRAETTTFDVAGTVTAYNDSFVRQALRAQTGANMVTAAIALERFRLVHHAYPETLKELSPDFGQAVPVDCMDGHDLRYRLNPDGTYLLYSVGSDGVDNGGDPTPEEGKKAGFRNGRDWVWPRPATAEELQAYEAEKTNPKNRK
jgi:hypothetical protein